MIKSRIAVGAALLAVAGAANAEFTLTPALTTDYDFRGFTQSNGSETLQLGLNWDTESGAYFGVWASEVEFVEVDEDGAIDEDDAVWEADVYAGYKFGDSEAGFGYDVGAIAYFYPSSQDLSDTYEVYAGVSKGWYSGKLYISPRSDVTGDNEIALYLDASAAIPLPGGFTLGLHAGYSFGDAWKRSAGEISEEDAEEGDVPHDYSFLDYSIGVSKSLARLDLNLKYVNSNDVGVNPIGRNAWIGTVSTTLPWRD